MNVRLVVFGILGSVGGSGCAPTTPATGPQPELTGASLAGFGNADAVTSRGGGSHGGTLTPRIVYAAIDARQDSAGQRSEWLRAIVLWRGAPGWMQANADPARTRAASDGYRRLTSQALLADRTVLGHSGLGTVNLAEMDANRRTLYVHGRELAIPERDSTLVVLIDDFDGSRGTPRIVGTVFVKGTVPSDAQQRSWTSGDTTYIVRPKRTREAVIREALEQSEVARDFLRPE